MVFSSSWSGVELRVMRPVCRMLVYWLCFVACMVWVTDTLELLMMGIMVPKHVEQAIRSAIKTSVASSWHFISTY